MSARARRLDLALDDLVRDVAATGVTLHGDGHVFVAGLQQDSRAVRPGDLFVARRGQTSDGVAHIPKALAAGAVAVLAERGAVAPGSLPVPLLLVDDVAQSLGFVASAIYRHPSFTLEVAGVTGTNGKTTTTHLLRSLLDGLAGRPVCATVGTVGATFGAETRPVAHTTPEGDVLARLFDALREDGAEAVAMEVSSIALALGRVNGVRFRVATFGNLTQDHLDFHGTMDAYGAAKRRLFTDLGPGAAVINVADPFGARLHRALTIPRLSVDATSAVPTADLRVTEARREGVFTHVTVATPWGPLAGTIPFVGAHNLENLLVALGAVALYDHPLAAVAPLLAGLRGAPGRLELVSAPGQIPVFVDYAHTPDALVRVLEALRPTAAGRLLCVFGCGGDRDASKRGPMGEAVGRGADLAVVTSDNPRTEDPAAIVRPIEEALAALGVPPLSRGALSTATKGSLTLLDRRAAIFAAVEAARPGDVVLIAGKGHEDYQIVGAVKHPFDDRAVAREALRERAPGEEIS